MTRVLLLNKVETRAGVDIIEIVIQFNQDQQNDFMSGMAKTVANKVNKAALKKTIFSIERNPDIFNSAISLTGDNLIRQEQDGLLNKERIKSINPKLELSKLDIKLNLNDPATLTQVFQKCCKLELVEPLNGTQIHGLKLKYTGEKNKKEYIAFANFLDYDLSKVALTHAGKQITEINATIKSSTNSYKPLMGVSSKQMLEQFSSENRSQEQIVRLLNTLDLNIKDVKENPTKVL